MAPTSVEVELPCDGSVARVVVACVIFSRVRAPVHYCCVFFWQSTLSKLKFNSASIACGLNFFDARLPCEDHVAIIVATTSALWFFMSTHYCF